MTTNPAPDSTDSPVPSPADVEAGQDVVEAEYSPSRPEYDLDADFWDYISPDAVSSSCSSVRTGLELYHTGRSKGGDSARPLRTSTSWM